MVWWKSGVVGEEVVKKGVWWMKGCGGGRGGEKRGMVDEGVWWRKRWWNGV